MKRRTAEFDRWLTAEAAGDETRAEAAFVAFFARFPRLAPAADFAERVLAAALSRLRPEYREVLVLRGQEGLAYEEIADITGLPLGTVKTYIHRGRKELAAHLIEAGWDPGADVSRG